MTYKQFYSIVITLYDCTDLDHFVAENGGKDWTEPYTAEQTIAILTAIWELKDNHIKGIKQAAHLTNRSMSEQYDISRRSIEDWCCGKRKCPAYTWMMMAYCVFTDAGIL